MFFCCCVFVVVFLVVVFVFYFIKISKLARSSISEPVMMERNTGDRLKKRHFQQFHEIIVSNICILGHSKLTNYLPI